VAGHQGEGPRQLLPLRPRRGIPVRLSFSPPSLLDLRFAFAASPVAPGTKSHPIVI
jgi:hypothetical protein